MSSTDSQKKTLFEKLKGAVLEDEPESRKVEESHKAAVTSWKQSVVSPADSAKAEADPEALASLESALQKAQTPGYASFLEQFQNLADVVPDESTRIKAALKTSHTNSAQITSNINGLLDLAGSLKEDVEKTYRSNLQKTELQAKQSLAATEDLIASKEAQLKAIQEEIASQRAKLETVSQQSQSEQVRLTRIFDRFEAAYVQVVSKLSNLRGKLPSDPK